jgi:hypothetical protein
MTALVLVVVWIAGWMLACGFVAWSNDDMGVIEYLVDVLFLTAIWPWYLYRIAAGEEKP